MGLSLRLIGHSCLLAHRPSSDRVSESDIMSDSLAGLKHQCPAFTKAPSPRTPGYSRFLCEKDLILLGRLYIVSVSCGKKAHEGLEILR